MESITNYERKSRLIFIDYSKTEIYRQLRPLLFCMRLFGLFFKRSLRPDGKPVTEVVILYCFVINCVLLFNVIRSFTVYHYPENFDNGLVQKVLLTIWSSECALKSFIFMWNCHRQSGLPSFFLQWNSVCGDLKLDRVCLLVMKMYVVLSFLFILVNSVLFTFMMIHVPEFEDMYLKVVWRNAQTCDDRMVFKVMLCVIAVLNSASSMFPMSLFVVLSCAIGKRLSKYTDELKISVAEDDFYVRVEDFRLRHQELCILIECLDKIFSPMIAAAFSANIPMFCLVLYTMLTVIEVHLCLVLINVFWLSCILLQMVIVSTTAAWLNVKMYLFLNKLTETKIGLTVIKMFVIDRPTVLTVAGMVITYFVILIQFKMPAATYCECKLPGHNTTD